MTKAGLSVEVPAAFPVSIEKHSHDSYWKTVGRHQHHNILQFFVLRSGSGVFYCGRQYLPISDGDFVIINNNEYHAFELQSIAAQYEVVKLDLEALGSYFPMDPAARIIRSIRRNHILFLARPDDGELRADLFSLLDTYNKPEPNDQLKQLSLVLDILCLLCQRHIAKSLTEKDARQLNQTWSKFQEVREYMENNYDSRITLEQMAEFTGMSKGYFCSRFKQITGKNFVEYLNLLRIEKAAAALIGTDRSVIDIALSTGFEDSNYFCRVFRRYMHCSPSEYRSEMT